MSRFLNHWRMIAVLVGFFKILIIWFTPVIVESDFWNWTMGASLVLNTVLAGRFPALSSFGVYVGILTILAPFFWLWTILPIEHSPLPNLVNYTTPAISLALTMKLPIFLCDILAGILVSRIVREIKHSERSSKIAFLVWFANPYNWYWLYVFGSMDILPTALVLLAVLFGMNSRWVRCGFYTTIAGLLRVAPFAALPFFLPLTKTQSTRNRLLLGAFFPLACTIGLLFATTTDTLATIVEAPLRQGWLMAFLGGNVTGGGQFVKLTPVLMIIQLYVVLWYWKSNPNIVHLTSVSFLALLLGATLYGGSFQHFIWVSPLLSASVALHPEESWIFALTFITASLSPPLYPINQWIPAREILDPFFAAAFYAMKATYLVRLNLWNLKT